MPVCLSDATNTTPGTLTAQTYFTNYSESCFGAGIGSGCSNKHNGSCSNITIINGSVNASSTNGADIGSGCAALLTGHIGSCSNITISGGSVNAKNIGCIPHQTLNPDSPEVYLCVIPNEGNDLITIDDTPWSPNSHIAVGSNEKKLYAWLTGETHTISVGDTTQTYYFNKKNNTFVHINFAFTAPQNLVYNGHSKKASLTNTENIGDFTLSYYNEQNELCTSAINAGTYIVKANIANDTYTFSDLVNKDWTFTINPAPEASGYTTETTKYVSWSYKKISDIPNLLPTDAWKWDTNVNPDQELPVGTHITATAIYNGSDKGNYQKEKINYTIIREECTHEHIAGRYYSSPSCTSSGYSGDTYCKDCNETISYGYTISAYGHDYDSGVITTEPTTETDGIITYTCKRCQHQDTKNLGKLGDGEPYIEGSFQKKSWDAVNDLIKASKEKDTISISLNGAKVLPASVLSEIKGKDISLNLDMENGLIWKMVSSGKSTVLPLHQKHLPIPIFLLQTQQNISRQHYTA